VRALVPAALVLAGCSAVAMALLVPAHGDPSRVYYGTDTRAQSLLVGAVLALLLRREDAADTADTADTAGDPADIENRPGRVRGAQALGLVGAGVLVAMLVGADGRDRWLYRGGFLLAALATVAVILAALQPDGFVRRVLSPRPLVWIGRISYGLYLWHWLIYVALTPDRTGLSGWALLGLRLMVTLAAAVLSYRFVEMPVRTWRPVRARWWPLPVATAGAMAVVTGLVVISTLGAQPPLPTASAASPAPPAPPAPPSPSGPTEVPGPPPAARPVPDPGQVRVVVLGDSVAFSLGYHFKAAMAPGVKTKTAALIGCGVVRGAHIINGRVSVPNPRCEQWPARWTEAVDSFDPDVALVMVGAWEVYDRKVDGRTLEVGTPEYESYLDSEMEIALGIAASRGAPVALLNVPCYQQPNLALGEPPSERNDPARVAWVNQVFQRIVARHPQRLRLIDLGGFLCPGGHDADKIDGVKVRTDGVHFTPEGAGVVWRWLGPQLVDLATHPDG